MCDKIECKHHKIHCISVMCFDKVRIFLIAGAFVEAQNYAIDR